MTRPTWARPLGLVVLLAAPAGAALTLGDGWCPINRTNTSSSSSGSSGSSSSSYTGSGSGSGSSALCEGMHVSHAHEALLAPVIVLLCGAFVRQLLLVTHAPIPYTVLLLLLGAGLGLMLRFFNTVPMDELREHGCDYRNESSVPLWDDVSEASIKMLGDIDPHLMLHIFLPPLIFESAFAIEWHIFDQLKWMTLTLAIPGVLVSTFTLGGMINAIMIPEDESNIPTAGDCVQECNDITEDGWGEVWSPNAGNLLGCILSATDPVAVVALLKELGVKAELSIGIEGESLLNDGTALVIFTVLRQMVQLPFATVRAAAVPAGSPRPWPAPTPAPRAPTPSRPPRPSDARLRAPSLAPLARTPCHPLPGTAAEQGHLQLPLHGGRRRLVGPRHRHRHRAVALVRLQPTLDRDHDHAHLGVPHLPLRRGAPRTAHPPHTPLAHDPRTRPPHTPPPATPARFH